MRDAIQGAVTVRTTLTIDDDVLLAARQRAANTGESIGQAISALARLGLAPTTSERKTRNGITLLPVRSGATGATLEEVNRLRDESP
jgi:hypothetical protein